MKAIKPLRFYMSLTFLIFLFFVLLFFQNQCNESLFVDQPAQEINFPITFLEPDYSAKSDPFTNKDFIGKKILNLVSLTHYASESFKVDEGKENIDKNSSKSNRIDFSYTLNELISAVHLQNFLLQLWGCKEVDLIKIKNVLHETKRSTVYLGTYNNKNVQVQVMKSDPDLSMNANCDLSDSERTQQNLDRCFLLKHRQLLDEIALFVQLSHSNIVGILGLCVRKVDFIDQTVSGLSSSEVILLKETGSPTSLEKLNQLSWNDRLQVCLDLLSLVVYFANTPLKSLRLESWEPQNFILDTMNRKILLCHFHQLLFPLEPSCMTDSQCVIAGVDLGISCILKRCVGYNAKKNLFELTHQFLLPLLLHNVHPKLSETVFDISIALKNPKIDPTDLAKDIQELLQKAQSQIFMKLDPGQHDMNKLDSSFVRPFRFSDTWKVDSSKKHDRKVAINEVDIKKIHKHQQKKIKSSRFGGEGSKSLDDNDQVHKKFIVYKNADFPGRYDYKCPKSRANWGCKRFVHTVKDAMQACLSDAKCKAFVTMPHRRKEGWILVVLKSDMHRPTDHAGTNVYIRQNTGGDNAVTIGPQATAREVHVQTNCIDSMAVMQVQRRIMKEQVLMKSCGWNGMTDADWMDFAKESTVTDARKFKPAYGRLAKGGQINVALKSKSQHFSAFFHAQQGPRELDVSHSAVYQIDRMLGLYKTIPAVERRLTSSQLSRAGFPTDVGGNRFDHFRSLKQADGSLIGVVIPKVLVKVVTEHHISVPPLSGITGAVTPFSRRQLDDLEYLLLGFLADIPTPSRGHEKVQGQLLHLKTEQAFRPNSNNYISYLYNCQFPSDVIKILRHVYSHRCRLSWTMRTGLTDSHLTHIGNIFQANMIRLLDLVDNCVARFGRLAVFYDEKVR